MIFTATISTETSGGLSQVPTALFPGVVTLGVGEEMQGESTCLVVSQSSFAGPESSALDPEHVLQANSPPLSKVPSTITMTFGDWILPRGNGAR